MAKVIHTACTTTFIKCGQWTYSETNDNSLWRCKNSYLSPASKIRLRIFSAMQLSPTLGNSCKKQYEWPWRRRCGRWYYAPSNLENIGAIYKCQALYLTKSLTQNNDSILTNIKNTQIYFAVKKAAHWNSSKNTKLQLQCTMYKGKWDFVYKNIFPVPPLTERPSSGWLVWNKTGTWKASLACDWRIIVSKNCAIKALECFFSNTCRLYWQFYNICDFVRTMLTLMRILSLHET